MPIPAMALVQQFTRSPYCHLPHQGPGNTVDLYSYITPYVYTYARIYTHVFHDIVYQRKTVINSLRPNDAIWRQRPGPTLALVMACCLTAPSHHLNQCRLIISEVQCQSHDVNFTKIPMPSATEISLKIIWIESYWDLQGTDESTDMDDKDTLEPDVAKCNYLSNVFTYVYYHYLKLHWFGIPLLY